MCIRDRKYTSPNANSALDIWPTENTVDLNIQDFVDAKIQRDEDKYNNLKRYPSPLYLSLIHI